MQNPQSVNQIMLCTLKLVACLSFLSLITFSCKTSYKEDNKDLISKKDSDILIELGDTKLDSNYIKAGCAITDSIKNQIPDIFAYTNFFYLYVQIKSYHPEYLNHFDCAEKLEKQVYPLFALDREPLNKIDYQSNIEAFTIHRVAAVGSVGANGALTTNY